MIVPKLSQDLYS